MIRVTHVRVAYSPDDVQTSGSIKAADAKMHGHNPGVRYEYEVTWEDGTKHLSRSREPSITAALRSWIENFTHGPAGKSAAERKAYLAQVDPGIREHLERMASGDLES